MNFNVSAGIALAFFLGLAIASPLPHQRLSDDHKCHGILTCNKVDLGLEHLIKVGDLGPVTGIIPIGN
ncbi:hypothetical protein PCANC_12135 [Puccinia coronata f. sp. avenae]|uniref:Hydrophobin n=1 Tax=Puccinia coronata f. sp. avenae TaxID=200324 RepID=A0A2N5VP16_9BASI|nr:hypothetical protein PCANC_14946 [Puccinia coronata f. sp. avenae]PLW23144.1 hypothetical protein PCASD_16505 [Puccinia coronata f. sp. avenae]PLW49073.1 hypothetical protein PCANC_12135 [Puccinia coronata f. sp. avenae]PLW51722.1 hypothetical protein PCASD_00566 [Puccinia coronata f. sp. avenae]